MSYKIMKKVAPVATFFIRYGVHMNILLFINVWI